MKQNDSTLISKNDPGSARAFYEALIGTAKNDGFDFVKIDVQASDLNLYRGRANAVEAHAWNAQALEEACRREMKGLINCMAHNSSCVFNTQYSAVTRCSIDYKVGAADRGKSHLQQSYNNTLWLGQTVWPDHDMFHSSDPHCGRMMSVSKALSGGPIYLSDDPKNFVADYIRPLAYENGELLRPLAPAVPLPDSIFLDALNEAMAYRVVAPLANDSAAVAAYNLMIKPADFPLTAAVTPEDYLHAAAMLQPYKGAWKIPDEGLVVYDWYGGKGQKLDRPYSIPLKGFSDRLLLLCPVRRGWAVVGRADKYLAPAAVKEVNCQDGVMTMTLIESGPFVIWCRRGEPKCEDLKFADIGHGFWKANMATGQRNRVLRIQR